MVGKLKLYWTYITKYTRSGLIFLWSLFTFTANSQKVLTVGVVGLSHDHIHWLLYQYKQNRINIAGIAEYDTALINRYKKSYQLPDSIFYPDINVMLTKIHPDAVLAYNPISEHLSVVEACAPKGIAVMVEKPLATTYAQATRMASIAEKYHIQLLTNYETTWYGTSQYIYELVNNKNFIGSVGKMVVHDGHIGPKEKGCSPDFLRWLTDSVKNGGGAVMDFGCYGANLMTWLMGGKAPIAVTAIIRHIKPEVYPQVDDDATIVLEYIGATGIIEASWNWPYSIKDWEVFGKTGYLHALNNEDLYERTRDTIRTLKAPEPDFSDDLTYLSAVLHGKINPGNDLSSLPNNLIVMKILDAARRSAKEGKRIAL